MMMHFSFQAIKAHSMGKHAEEAWYLLKAESWNKCHSIVIKHLASDAVINGKYISWYVLFDVFFKNFICTYTVFHLT